jgi:hypothetical protein
MGYTDFEFLKGYAETEEFPLVLCDIDFKIRFMNRIAAKKYEKYGGYEMIGRTLSAFLNEEAQSKVDMVVEWFKESADNNTVLSVSDTSCLKDIYMCALRDDDGKLIGFCSKHISRKQDESNPYETID